MPIITRDQLLARFGNTDTKKVKVKAWKAEVEIRRLTIAESNAVTALLLRDMPMDAVQDGQVEVSIGRTNEAAVLAVSYALVSPAMTVHELSALADEGMAGITEIKEAIDRWDQPKKPTAGSKNSGSPSPSAGPSKS